MDIYEQDSYPTVAHRSLWLFSDFSFEVASNILICRQVLLGA